MKKEKPDIDKILNSLEGIERAEPRPFFFTRLEARMQKENNVWSTITGFLARPAMAFSVIVIVLIINAVALLGSFNSQQTVADTEMLELPSIDEYSQISGNIANFENFAP